MAEGYSKTAKKVQLHSSVDRFNPLGKVCFFRSDAGWDPIGQRPAILIRHG